MSELNDKELLEQLGVEIEPNKKKGINSEDEYIISQFIEIQEFYKNSKLLPKNNINQDIFERILSIRLQKIITSKDLIELLKPFDFQNLLNEPKDNNSIDQIQEMNDVDLIDELFEDNQESSITELNHVRSSSERKLAEEFATREICKDFKLYKPLFDQIQIEIKSGKRKLIKLKNRPEIKSRDFYILYGQKTYVSKVGEFFKQEYGKIDARLHLIFDNGTESRMLMRSFQKALSLDTSSRVISTNNLGPLFRSTLSNDDLQDGTLYVLRSNSENPFIKSHRSLIHKIGYTTGKVSKRIANAKNDPTFLMAEVEVVDSYRLFNLKSSKFEHLVQVIFSSSKINVEIKDRFGNIIFPEEWFFVPLNVIKDAIQKIIDGSITQYIYDPSLAKLVERKN